MSRMILLFATIGFGSVCALAQEAPTPDPADAPVSEPAEAPVSDPAEAPVSDPAEVPVSEPAEAPVSDPAEVPASDPADDTAAISETAQAYAAAFNKGDAAALAGYWTEDAVFVAPSGRKFEGRQAIQEGFEAFFKENDGAKMEIDITSIRLDGTDVAVEEGTVRLTLGDQPEPATTYTARYKKEADGWKLTSVSERLPAPSHYEQLKPLEWLVGEWGDRDESGSVRTVCRWTKNKNFISRSFAVTLGDQVDLEGTQVIGWDPDKQVIRSWLFDSDGGFAVGLWTQKEDRWTIKALHVLSDGKKASSVNTITRVDDNTFTWQSTGRAVDGEVLPNLGPVTIERKQADD